MRGISGAGKSTYTKANHPTAVVCSADDFFIENGNGVYLFDREKLGKAHGRCQAQFEENLRRGTREIVVDNTNTTMREMKFYLETAKKYGYEVSVVRLAVDPKIAAARNLHGVPAEGIQNMQNRFQDFPGETIVNTSSSLTQQE